MARTKDEKRKFAEARATGKSKKDSALIAINGITEKSASVVGHRLSKDIDVQTAIMQTLEDAGLDYASILRPIAEGLSATKVITSHTEPDYEIPDWAARLKSADMAVKLLLLNKTPTKAKPQPLTDEIKDRIAKGDMPTLERIVFNSGAK